MKKRFLLLLLTTVLSAQLCGLAKADETDSPASADTSSISEEDYTEYENVEDTPEADIANIALDSSSDSELVNEEISTIPNMTSADFCAFSTASLPCTVVTPFGAFRADLPGYHTFLSLHIPAIFTTSDSV